MVAVAVEHRVGHLEVGDLAVVVAVGAVHRGPALAACAHLINTLKAEVPIWKEQRFASGTTAWVGLPEADEPAGGADRGQDRRLVTRQTWTAFVSALLFVGLALLLVVVPVPFVSWSPGGARDTLGTVGQRADHQRRRASTPTRPPAGWT